MIQSSCSRVMSHSIPSLCSHCLVVLSPHTSVPTDTSSSNLPSPPYILHLTKVSTKGVDTTKKQLNLLQKNISRLEASLRALPDGNLICTRNGSKGQYVRWYANTGNGLRYLSKKERELAKKLAQRKYLSLELAKLIKQLEHLTDPEFIRNQNIYSEKICALTSDSSPYAGLLADYSKDFQVGAFTPDIWQNASFPTNPSHPEHLLHKSLSGEKLRSKSEVIIANALFMNHIPYRYECELLLGEVSLFPDFTILHPVTHEVFYWEHFGLMNNPDYRNNASQKLRLYLENQIYPSERLITTFESDTLPLDSGKIQHLIEQYFL